MGRKQQGKTPEQRPEQPAQLELSGCLYEIDGYFCGQPVRARGYCMRHYKILNRKGAFKDTRELPPGSDAETVDRNMGHVERARQALDAHAEAAVAHLMTAAEAAAKKGDSGPAQWILLHTRTVQPVLTGGAASGGKDAPAGIRVMIGVQLGTQSGQSKIQTIESQSSIPVVSAQNAGTKNCLAPGLPTVNAELIPG
jgi:hypothetical protein